MTFEYGDVIFADHLVYKHFGIYAGKNSRGEDIIIHFATPKGEKMFNMSKAIVHETTMSYFSQGCSVHKYDFYHFTEYSWQDFLSDVFKKKIAFLAAGKLIAGAGAGALLGATAVGGMLGGPIGIALGYGIGKVLFDSDSDNEPIKLYSPQETVRRAYGRLKEKEYNPLFNNCEHIAIWCKTGISESTQIDMLKKALARYIL